jgi:hypothetical protein
MGGAVFVNNSTFNAFVWAYTSTSISSQFSWIAFGS